MRSLKPRSFLVALILLAAAACGGGFNRYQGMDADALYRLATEEYAENEFDNAADALDRLLLAYADWDRLPEARMLLGHARYADRDYLTARSEYVRFLDRYGGHADAVIAALGVCRSLAALSPDMPRDQVFTRDAIIVCRNVVLDYQGTPGAIEAAGLANRMRLKLAEKEYDTADFYFRRKMWDSAIKYYEFVTRLYAETEFAPMSLAGIYRANVAIGYEDEAEAAKQRLLERYPESPEAAAMRGNASGS
ncbi:MAG: outer membrane protein assembly factor BamD [Gemmatimonadetes bacterium]|nr:outer membrane protein assembly factor BamD [Gemmatimonadota bacterium]